MEILEGRRRVIRQIPSVGLVWIFSGTTKLSVTLRLQQQSCRTMTKLSSLSYSDRFLSTTLVKTLRTLTQWLVKIDAFSLPSPHVVVLKSHAHLSHFNYNQHCLAERGTTEIGCFINISKLLQELSSFRVNLAMSDFAPDFLKSPKMF